MTCWYRVEDYLPNEGTIVNTRIKDENGVGHENKLFRRGDSWFLPDGTLCLFYKPTHWSFSR